jgi:tetratricopeptide (TPR) repeat protein
MILTRQLPAVLCLAIATAVLAAGSADAAPQGAATIGDLAKRSIEVHPDASVSGGAAKAMQSYRDFLKLQNTDAKLRAEALRRLGDLNLESGELERMSSEVTQLDMQGAEAIRLYSTLLKAYPDYPRNDQVLYQLARAYETTGQSELALSTLDQVVARYPATREIAEVHFRRGELLFSAKRYADAESAYQQVIKRGAGNSTFYEQSLYKHGWSLFKQSQNEACLKSFASLLDRTLLDRKTGAARKWESLSRADRELTDDTLRVMSISFSYLDGPQSLDQLLSTRGPTPYAWLMYSRLGDLYVQKQRFQDAANTYRAFVARDPVDEHAPTLSNQAIAAYAKGGFADLVIEGKAEYVRSYGFKTAFWRTRERGAFPEVVAELKTNLKDLAQYYHATAQKTKKLEDYKVAGQWYRDLLAAFPDDADSPETNYLLAEELFESHQYADAATEYERTAYGYAPGARSAAAGYAALVALQKQEELLPPGARADVHTRAMESGVHFAQVFPEHPESAGVLTRAAQDVFAAHDLPRAIKLSETLLARNPPVDAAKQRIGWTIIGQSRFDQAEYSPAETAFQRALMLIPAGTPEHADLTERLAAAIYRQGEAKRQAGDEVGAATDFLRVVNVAPASKVVPTAMYDAAASFINAKQWDQAIVALETYRRRYPTGQYGADVTRKLAVAYVEAGRGAQAAAEFERIAATPGEDAAVTREATMRAADLYDKSGNTERATAMLEQFVQRYPVPVTDATEARARLADLAGKAGNSTRVDYWRNEIIKADATAGAGRTDRTRFLAAGARLALAAPARDAFRAVRLTAPLKKSLVAKKQAMETALAGYKAVVAYDISTTTTAATYEMAELYRTLGRDLLASERPKKLSADEREQFDALLEEQAFPFEEQAIKIHEVNAKRTVDGIYDESVRRSFQALAEMSPARYAKTEVWGDLLRSLVPPAGSEPDARAVTDFTRGVANAISGKPTDAELDFKQMELQYPMLAEPSVNLGIVLQGQGKLDEAAAALQRATERAPGNAVAWNELGLVRRSLGKFPEAKSAYQQAIAADTSYAPAHRNLAVLLDLYLADPAAALPELEQYRQLSGEDKPVSGWIAELRRRTGIKAPPPPAAEPAAAPAADQAAAPAAAAAAAPAPADTPATAAGAAAAPAAEAPKGAAEGGPK